MKPGYVCLAIIALALVFGLAQPLVSATTATYPLSGVYLRSTAAQGWVTWSGTLYQNGLDLSTGSRVNFANPALGSTSSQWGTLGFSSDTAAVNMTLTLIDTYKVKYVATGAGTQRLYCTGVTPPRVDSGGSGIWDGSTNTLTITTTGASTVTVKWDVASSQTYDAANILASMLPLLAVFVAFGILKDPSQWKIIVGVAALIAVIALFGWIFYTWNA